MRPFWKKNASAEQEPSLSGAADLDLLAQQEEAAFIASVLKKRQERETPPLVEDSSGVQETDEIEWSEQEDTYRPHRVRFSELTATLPFAQTPDLQQGELCCVVRQPAYAKIQAHLRSDTRIELGGLLVGEAFYDPERALYCVVVEEALPAFDGEGTALTFAYTGATWQTLSPKLQELPAHWTLLGSYHSHPGMGVFLSSTDMETQRGIFFHDWQIALVIDPISNAVGFFFGAEGHRCSHWELV